MTSRASTGNRHGSAIVTTPSDTEILIRRVFDAPAELLFRAWTEPALVRRWWGFDTGEWLVCEVDLRVGGGWRWVVRDRGMEVGFHGEYRQIERPTLLVATEVYEGFPDAEAVNTTTFAELDGITTMTTLVRHARTEHRDAHLESGMEGGMQVSFDRMEDLVRGLAEGPVPPGS
jgi:uncharacterized protein YndB with AHSA1/START domain